MRPRQGDIVLIPVPFTDLSSRKRRPVIVVSSDAYNALGSDMIVVAMTSNPSSIPWSFRIEQAVDAIHARYLVALGQVRDLLDGRRDA